MKSVMISIQPKWVEKIISGEQTIIVRKNRPKLETPFKCYIYQTKSKDNAIYKQYKVDDIRSGKVIGEFVCDRIMWIPADGDNPELTDLGNDILEPACISYDELCNYGNGKTLYGWHISDLKIYDKPKMLDEFSGQKCKHACYQGGEWYNGWFCGQEENYEDCKYFDCPKCSGENNDYEDFAYCLGKGLKPIKRPPQSWGYVAEVEE